MQDKDTAAQCKNDARKVKDPDKGKDVSQIRNEQIEDVKQQSACGIVVKRIECRS